VGRIKEDNVTVDLNELIPGIIDGIAAPEHIRIEVQPGLPVITGEKTRITQVFQNLLSNAVKFMDKPAGLVKIDCIQDGRFWRFRVADNGPGIEKQYFDRIFKLFQTLAPRDEFESTGVGLAVVKKIVEMYGGRIWVESRSAPAARSCSRCLCAAKRLCRNPRLSGLPADSCRDGMHRAGTALSEM
jgi:signal transduction histidine kinase